MKRHNCGKWSYHAGMATCPHGWEILPSGNIRRPPARKWQKHREAIDAIIARSKKAQAQP